jgi:hypothetical protein
VDSELVTGFIRLDYNHDKLQSHETVSSTALISTDIKLESSSGTNSSSWYNQRAKLARLLISNSNCLLWPGTRPALEMPLDSGIPSYYVRLKADISQECSASIIMVTRIGELGTMLAVNSKWSTVIRNTTNK